MPDGEVTPLPNPVETSMEFRLSDLKTGQPDPRGRKVLDVLWAVREFKIYKTAEGISPFFSDDPDEARRQKLAYLDLGMGIGDFNHLIQLMQPPIIPFTDLAIPNSPSREKSLRHYERELARCIAQSLLGQEELARTSLGSLRDRLATQISNRGRVVHLLVNIVLVGLAIIGSHMFVRSGYVPIFGFDVTETGLSVMMGSIGALFSTTVRLQQMAVDPSVSNYMHWVYGSQRVMVGALGALIVYFGFQSGVLGDLLTGSGILPPPSGGINPYWLSFVCVLAGFSERLVPNLLEAKATIAQSKQTADGD